MVKYTGTLKKLRQTVNKELKKKAPGQIQVDPRDVDLLFQAVEELAQSIEEFHSAMGLDGIEN